MDLKLFDLRTTLHLTRSWVFQDLPSRNLEKVKHIPRYFKSKAHFNKITRKAEQNPRKTLEKNQKIRCLTQKQGFEFFTNCNPPANTLRPQSPSHLGAKPQATLRSEAFWRAWGQRKPEKHQGFRVLTNKNMGF